MGWVVNLYKIKNNSTNNIYVYEGNDLSTPRPEWGSNFTVLSTVDLSPQLLMDQARQSLKSLKGKQNLNPQEIQAVLIALINLLGV